MNYKIEDGIDFNACLMEAICIDSDSDEEENDNKCLISDMPLNKIQMHSIYYIIPIGILQRKFFCLHNDI